MAGVRLSLIVVINVRYVATITWLCGWVDLSLFLSWFLLGFLSRFCFGSYVPFCQWWTMYFHSSSVRRIFIAYLPIYVSTSIHFYNTKCLIFSHLSLGLFHFTWYRRSFKKLAGKFVRINQFLLSIFYTSWPCVWIYSRAVRKRYPPLCSRSS